MAYDQNHLYLTINWADSREPLEGGQVGIRFDSPAEEVTQAMVDAAKTAVQTFWTSTGALIPSSYVLKYLRLAAIGTDGKYLPGTFSRDGSFGAGVSTSNATVYHPLQVASVATFTTERPSGIASRGRIYLPPLAAAIGSNGRWTQTVCDARAAALATMLSSLNASTAFSGSGLPAFAAVFSKGTSKSPAGVRSFIRGVKIGTRPDVQRRRAKNMLEVYGATSAVTGPTP